MAAAWGFAVAPRIAYFLGSYSQAQSAFLGKGCDNAKRCSRTALEKLTSAFFMKEECLDRTWAMSRSCGIDVAAVELMRREGRPRQLLAISTRWRAFAGVGLMTLGLLCYNHFFQRNKRSMIPVVTAIVPSTAKNPQSESRPGRYWKFMP